MFPDSKKLKVMMYLYLNNFGKIIKDGFQDIPMGKKWKIFILLMNLRLVISAVKKSSS